MIRQLGSTLALGFILLIGLWCLLQHVVFNPSISITRGYYFSMPVTHYKAGDIVLLCIENPRYVRISHLLGLPHTPDVCRVKMENGVIDAAPYLMKQIVALPHDEVTISNSGVSVNGHQYPLSRGLIKFKQIMLYRQKNQRFILGDDEFFVLGHTAHSYDSRYFGIVKLSQIHARAWLLFACDRLW